jgi:TonB family protein
MPLNVGRLYTSIFLVLSALSAVASAQVVPLASPSPSSSPAVPPVTQPIANAPTAAEVMRARISKAKAFIAVRNYNAAIYELESIRRETSDTSVQTVTNILLMNSYLEQGDHKRAQALLNDFYNQQKTIKPNALANYMSVAGQIVKGARNQVERYRSLGLTVTDRNLPLEALNDLEKMRETVELVITQSKELGNDKKKAATALGLLEEATNSRAMIARDDYDARRWRDAVADSREQMASSRSVITNAVDGTTESAASPIMTVALNTNAPGAVLTAPKTAESQPAITTPPPVEPKPTPSETLIASNDKPIVQQPNKIEEKPAVQPERSRIIPGASDAKPEVKKDEAPKAAESSKSSGPLDVGSLIVYATKQAPAIYPAAAKTIRATGIVKVEVTVDEEGNVTEIQKASGPSLLQGSAKDAIRKWKFKPFLVDGQPVKATGFVNFNFSL